MPRSFCHGSMVVERAFIASLKLPSGFCTQASRFLPTASFAALQQGERSCFFSFIMAGKRKTLRRFQFPSSIFERNRNDECDTGSA